VVPVPAVLQLQKTEANANAKNILFMRRVLFLIVRLSYGTIVTRESNFSALFK
jgi:hypothetical protein